MPQHPSSAIPVPVSTGLFVAVSAIAGVLALPLNVVASPVATVVAVVLGLLGLRMWRWSRLPRLLGPAARPRSRGLVLSAASLGLGLVTGVVLLAVIRLAIEPHIPAAGARIAAAATLPLWRRVAIIYVAAVGEEIVFRLILVSVVTAVLMRLVGRTADVPSRPVVVAAIALSAVAFGAAHLPAWSAVGPLHPGLVALVVALNSLAGVVFGTAFATRGIVAAMWAHAGADCAIQLIGPLT